VRNRLLLVFVGVVALVLAVHDVPLARHLERVERDRLVTKLERDAFTLAGRAEEALEGGTASTDAELQALVERYAASEQVRVVVVDQTAAGVAGSDPTDLAEDFSNRPEIESALGGVPTTGQRFSSTLNADLFFVAVPVLSGEEVVGAVRLSALADVVSKRTQGQVRGLLLVAAISLVIASGVAWLFATRVTRSIRNLQAATQGFANGELSTRAETGDGPPEIRDLAVSFNAMAARLQQLVERQRTFAGTASHQLRTPLTALRLRLEQLSMAGPEAPDAERITSAALAETDRLHRMIEGLLALSRAEDAATGAVEVDLAAIASERVAHWTPLADERQVRLSVVAPGRAPALAVAGGADQIIDNLIDNALDVSPEGSTLTVRIDQAVNGWELHVIDEGPGLEPHERDRAFDRFWRGTSASPGGSGLGLAIVRQLAGAAGGTAELRQAPSGGVDATVLFQRPERTRHPVATTP
jgi:signal transduction histidine kinase